MKNMAISVQNLTKEYARGVKFHDKISFDVDVIEHDIVGHLRPNGAGKTTTHAGIIDVANYIGDSGGAPEKVWKLKIKRIVINLIEEEGN